MYYKVCSIHRIELVLTTRTSLIICTIMEIAVDCAIVLEVPVEALFNNIPITDHLV